MYFDNDWVMLLPVATPGPHRKIILEINSNIALMNTDFNPMASLYYGHTNTNMFVLFWINCINIGRCFFIQLNSSLHLHNLLFWSTFSKAFLSLFPLLTPCLSISFHAQNHSGNLLLNFHYITHWFYHFLCKWNCGKAFSASAIMKFPFFDGVNAICC